MIFQSEILDSRNMMYPFNLFRLFFWGNHALKLTGGQRMKSAYVLIDNSGFPN